MRDPLNPSPTPGNSSRPRPTALARRAKAHTPGRAAARLGLWAGLTAGLLGCGPEPADGAGEARAAEAAGPIDPEARARIEALLETYVELDPTLTTDHHDAQLRERRRQQKALEEAADVEVGRAALAIFDERAELPALDRAALLKVAAANDPVRTAPRLETILNTYQGGRQLGLRAQVVDVFAACAPERALEVLAPLVLARRMNATYPDKEILVRGWIKAARATGVDDPRVLADVATALDQPPSARYAAIDGLALFPCTLSARALETVLTESASDALMRRKAAQAMQVSMSPEELCPILIEVSRHEGDIVMLNFLGDMIDHLCP